LVANLTTLRDTCIDDAVIFEGGEHPVIKHRTTVAYSRAKVFSAKKMKEALSRGVQTSEPAFEGQLVEQILAGALVSPELAHKYKAMIEQKPNDWKNP